MLPLADLVATLPGLLSLGAGQRGGAEVVDLTIAEPSHQVHGQPGDLVLGVGVESVEAAVELIVASAGSGAAGLALRRGLARRRRVRDAGRRQQLSVVEVAERASWAHLVWLLRGIIDRAALGPVTPGGARVEDDLFSLADAAAALVEAPVTIEDAQSRVLAYSSQQDLTDPARVSTIVGRRVPDDVLTALRGQGVFRRLARSKEPIYVPETAGLKPRLVIPVRAGGQWLGSIWAVVAKRPPDRVVAELVQTASVVALHLLRVRAQVDLGRLVLADRIRGLLTGTATDADWLPPGPWRVVRLAGRPRDPGALDLWESVLRRNGWNQPLLAESDSRVYAVLRDAPEATPGTWDWLAAVVAHQEAAVTEPDAGGEPAGILSARAGRPARTPRELARSRREAQEAHRVCRRLDRPPAWAAHEDLWAEVTIARAAAALGEDLGEPLATLASHDSEQGSDHLRTLTAWLDHPGAPTAAARALHVHPNTLRYRMARIVELAGLDLNDPTVRLAVRLQLAALEPGSATGRR